MKYFAVWNTEDGMQVGQFGEKELKDFLSDMSQMEEDGGDEFRILDSLDSLDESSPYGHVVVIRGEIFSPKPKQIVRGWDFT